MSDIPAHYPKQITDTEICALCAHVWPCDVSKLQDRLAIANREMTALREQVQRVRALTKTWESVPSQLLLDTLGRVALGGDQPKPALRCSRCWREITKGQQMTSLGRPVGWKHVDCELNEVCESFQHPPGGGYVCYRCGYEWLEHKGSDR